MQTQGFKVRLEDGSEVGPLDGAALRDWRSKGLIGKATPVLPPGSRAWTTLGRVLDGAKPPAPGTPAGQARRAGPRVVSGRPARAVGRSGVAASRILSLLMLLVLIAAGAAAWVTLGPSLAGLASRLGLGTSAVQPAAAPPPSVAAAPSGRDAALAAARSATPHLSEGAARALMEGSTVGVLEPPELFRRGWLQVNSGMKALSADETRELRALTGALYAPLSSRERRALGAYIERVRGRRATTPAEDAAQAAVVARAFERLKADQQQRLRALLEKAVLASLGRSVAGQAPSAN